jgi:hypothetical protein
MKTNHLVAASIAFICLGLIAMFKPNTVTQEPVRVLEVHGFDSDSLPYKIHVSAMDSIPNPQSVEDSLRNTMNQFQLDTMDPDSVLQCCEQLFIHFTPSTISISYPRFK